jgi:hypothetical protein
MAAKTMPKMKEHKPFNPFINMSQPLLYPTSLPTIKRLLKFGGYKHSTSLFQSVNVP